MNLNSLLRRVFRSYNAESNKKLSPWRQRMLEVDERYAALIAERDNANDQRKNKRMVPVEYIGKDGKKHRHMAGILVVRDHGSPQEKLRKAFGGKTMRRILKAERRAARENPDALVVHAIGEDESRNQLTRGVDFAMIPRAHGGPTLVLHDMAQKFEATYSPEFADALAGGRA